MKDIIIVMGVMILLALGALVIDYLQMKREALTHECAPCAHPCCLKMRATPLEFTK